MNDSEDRLYYKIGEVCELTGTQPYVLRFWESEFPTLAPEKNRSGQRVYRKRDVDLIQRIKALLYEKEYTIAGARKVLETEGYGEDEIRESGSLDEHEPPRRERPDVESGDAAARRASAKAAPRAIRSDGLADDTREPALPFRTGAASRESSLESEIRNLRAKLSVVESELKAILADMDRRDES